MPAKDETFYPLDYKTIGEAERINWQHALMTRMTGGPLPGFIDASKLGTIADVATGTGAWLEEVQRGIASKISDGVHRIYHGFDIADKVFQPTSIDNATFKHTIHDLTVPFSEEFQGQFDLVHIRFTNAFMRQSNVDQCVRNVSELVKPGGLLCWTEVDMSRTSLTNPDNERHREIFQILLDWTDQVGACMTLPQDVETAARANGFRLCESKTYYGASIGPLEEMQRWEYENFKALLPAVLPKMRPDQDPESTKQEVKTILDDLVSIFGKGEVWDIATTTATYRRPIM